jgi:hypothetical protein
MRCADATKHNGRGSSRPKFAEAQPEVTDAFLTHSQSITAASSSNEIGT